MRKNSQSGLGLIEVMLLTSLAIIMVAFVSNGMSCLLKQAFSPFVSLSGGTKTALCESTEAINYTRIVFGLIGLGTPAFLWVRNRTDRRRG